ncbi:MAG: class I SAM-dependent RNA methyltransferase [Nitrospirae bacterium]|nr:class I SAM-dependent RNA methyltransferase [Nitrospirota bacterium]
MEREASRVVVKAETPVYGGYVLGREGKVIFIKGAIPGEVVGISIDERKRDYSVASVKEVIEPSPARRESACPVFGICGGCQLQFAEYGRQVSMKEEILADAMKRISGLDVSLMPSLSGKEFRYRRRGQFKVSRDGAIGFYREGTRDVVPVEACAVMCDEINAALGTFRAMDLEGVKEIHVSSGDSLAVLIKGDLQEEAAQFLLEHGVSGIAFENGDSLGKDYVTLDLNGLTYSVTPWSFFQSHWSLNRTVVETVVRELSPLEEKRVLDLYAGAGNFSLPLAGGAKEVTAVEENAYAVEDGRRNLALNGIKNCNFFHLAIEKSLESRKNPKSAKLFEESRYDVIVIDPPRPGLTGEALGRIIETGCETIVYLSCNPATLARDVKRMNGKYSLESIRLIDFFPHTYHIEAMALLRRRGSVE